MAGSGLDIARIREAAQVAAIAPVQTGKRLAAVRRGLYTREGIEDLESWRGAIYNALMPKGKHRNAADRFWEASK